jgi:5-methylcytosine-specific restriction endonuclease McrA
MGQRGGNAGTPSAEGDGFMPGDDSADSLGCSVLVLNRLYLAVHVVGVRRAFSLICREMAEIVHHEDGAYGSYDFDGWREYCELKADARQPHEDWIRAVHFEIKVPRVIRLLAYDRVPRRMLRLNRHTVFARDGHTCQYCGRRLPSSQLSLDHVIPRSRGGRSTWENVVCACLSCNVKKGGRTPHEAHMKLRRAPTRPKRSPLLALKLRNPKYESWKMWLEGAYCEVGI